MKTWVKILVCLVLSFSFLFLTVGYATLTDTLSITGFANVHPIDYDEIIIMDVVPVSGTTASSLRAYPVYATNVDSVITGSAGQTVVYQITAKNHSNTKRYVYTGMNCSDEFADVSGKLQISVSEDAGNTQPLPKNGGATWTQGTPIEPGAEFVFYATYDLTGDLSADRILMHYHFAEIDYTVTYLNNNQVYVVDCVTDNSSAYPVRSEGPPNSQREFAYWMNTNAIQVTSYPAGNTNDYTLSAKWKDIYLIIFADADGSVIYQENFTQGAAGLSAAGQAVVDAKLAELNAAVSSYDLSVSWSEYNMATATGDLTVRAIYNYNGYLNLVPVYEEPDDGIVDYYKVMAVDSLPEDVYVPGWVGNIPVRVIERITNIDGEDDWNNYEKTVKRIIVGEGVQRLEWNSLAWTPNLAEVNLPSSLYWMGKNVFSRNDLFGNDKKKLTINFNGTMAEWEAIVARSDKDWDGGLKTGSRVVCSNGYFELSGVISQSWKKTYY